MAERKQNGKKETKHVNNAEIKKQNKERIKHKTNKTNKQKKNVGKTTCPPIPPPDRCVGVENSKNTQKSKGNILRRMVDGMRMASSMRLKQESTHEILKPNDTFLPPHTHLPTKKKPLFLLHRSS